VQFLGERLDMRPIVAAADLGWVVAAGDAGALDCLTFMEFGVPIVAERSPLTQHYAADSVTGLLLAPAEPAYHASSVTALLANPELRTTMGQAGRSRAEREFSWSAMADALERAVVATAEAGLKRA
jgi:glycosyltransferase involved in cell wall biosynthesis